MTTVDLTDRECVSLAQGLEERIRLYERYAAECCQPHDPTPPARCVVMRCDRRPLEKQSLCAEHKRELDAKIAAAVERMRVPKEAGQR